MQITVKDINETKVKVTIIANEQDILPIKNHVVSHLAPKVKLAGFREGKVPLNLAEKHIDQNQLQSEVLDAAIRQLFSQAVAQEKLRIIAAPNVELSKFVPFTLIEFSSEVEVIGKIKLPDYKKIIVKKPPVIVSAKDVDEVLGRLQLNMATFTVVDRASKTGDRIWIDFRGKDGKDEPVKGAEGKDYPLSLGSNTFIPGFEDNIIGLKKGDKKSFTLDFPKDYQVKALQNKKVTFDITVKKVEETKLDKIDDEFAKKAGPFKDIEALKLDIKKQIEAERNNQSDREYEENIVKTIASKTKFSLPDTLINEQIDSLDKEFKQSLAYRGQTFKEYLESRQITEEEYREQELKPAAIERLKAGIVINEIADRENIKVTKEEIEIRIQILKNQYKSDASMQSELSKPDNKQEIGHRLITEKTILKLVDFNKNN
jgi:trigger factor